MTAKEIQKETGKIGSPERAKALLRFFKTGKGEYGEGDKFLGLILPQVRDIAKRFKDISLFEVSKLMYSPFHEERTIAIIILTHKYQKRDNKREIFDFYLQNTKFINNWDLVDISAHKIVGEYLVDKDRTVLYKLAGSQSLWERRIAIISTFAFIKNGELTDSIKLAEVLLTDKHDLIHKAVGWVLREVGKKDVRVLEEFLNKHAATMPRTALRYAIEKFPEAKRKLYLNRQPEGKN